MNSIINKIKGLDLVSIVILSLIAIFILSMVSRILTKTNKKDFDISNKKIGTYTVNKICYDLEGVTECVEIKKDVYRLVLINETITNEIPTLYIKK